MNKKGLEMSINVIVAIVLGLMLFIAGITLFTTLFNKTSITNEAVNAQLEKELINAFDDDSPIFVYRSTITLSSEHIARFAFGIHNIYGETNKFKVSITSLNTSAISNDKISFLEGPYDISAKDKKPIIFLIDAKGAPLGQYAFKINITMQDPSTGLFRQYFDPKIVYVSLR